MIKLEGDEAIVVPSDDYGPVEAEYHVKNQVNRLENIYKQILDS